MSTPIAPLTTREVNQRAVELLEHTGLMGADAEEDAEDWKAAQLLQQICDSHDAALADARATRELVRRALASHRRRSVWMCNVCSCYTPGLPHSTCECAPGVSWVRDAIAAGLHNEEVGP